jgi:hypothetical protein
VRKVATASVFLLKISASLAGMLAASYAFYLMTVMAATGYRELAVVAFIGLCFIMLGIANLWR